MVVVLAVATVEEAERISRRQGDQGPGSSPQDHPKDQGEEVEAKRRREIRAEERIKVQGVAHRTAPRTKERNPRAGGGDGGDRRWRRGRRCRACGDGDGTGSGVGGGGEIAIARGKARPKVQGADHRTAPRTKERRRRARQGEDDRQGRRDEPRSREQPAGLPQEPGTGGGRGRGVEEETEEETETGPPEGPGRGGGRRVGSAGEKEFREEGRSRGASRMSEGMKSAWGRSGGGVRGMIGLDCCGYGVVGSCVSGEGGGGG